ncbi:hypothetical protein I8748_12345 [Nostoc sp. CENA67]|uniref:Uncharacterized protein n=1 Tax=Amazonocrinis nigriterrae CENA67 TaxID=2794033 RepID=A0A8J7HP46_9NOST|nr:hypothetical protein [Amazonocrinis nigriterrae]MBH8562962.1 hypothetical protein [Amazonocrinis nigriterrae CENA67]
MRLFVEVGNRALGSQCDRRLASESNWRHWALGDFPRQSAHVGKDGNSIS